MVSAKMLESACNNILIVKVSAMSRIHRIAPSTTTMSICLASTWASALIVIYLAVLRRGAVGISAHTPAIVLQCEERE